MPGEAVKVELIADGQGSVIAFVNGRPVSQQFWCERFIDQDLSLLLENFLCKYHGHDFAQQETVKRIVGGVSG
jgi:hypothetical protein